jgi:sugar phosphate isomerase/epimerase
MPGIPDSDKADNMKRITDSIQIHVPFTMLYESLLDLFIEHGLNPEIALDAAALNRFSSTEFNDIAEKLHGNNASITLHAPFIDLSPGSPDPAVRKLARHRFGQFLDLVPIFKPKTIVCHTGYDIKRYWSLKDAWIENSLEMWSWFGNRVSGQGVTLMFENVYEHGPEDILVLIENLENHPVGFCLDTGHQAVFSTTPLESWIDTLSPYLGQLHLHDNCGIQDDHLALGRGNIDFTPVFHHLKTRKEDPPVVTLEPHTEADLWPSLAYLEKMWPW